MCTEGKLHFNEYLSDLPADIDSHVGPGHFEELPKNLPCTCPESLNKESHAYYQKKTALYGDMSKAEEPCHWIWVLVCQSCASLLAFWNGHDWWQWQEILVARDENRHGICKVDSMGDRLVLYILSQICYKLDQDASSTQAVFLPPPPGEFAKVIWHHGKAVGFYTLKEKGSTYSGSQCDVYAMPVVDMIYIRKGWQRQGFATQLLEDALGESSSGGHLAFSSPVSKEMLAVLLKYLASHPEWRDHIWEVEWTGGEGYRTNVWLRIKALVNQNKLAAGGIS